MRLPGQVTAVRFAWLTCGSGTGDEMGSGASELPSGTVTFSFTDLEGSTRLWEECPAAMQPALTRHDEIVGEAIVSHRGHVVKTTGDGFHEVFAAAADAAGAAVGAQQDLAAKAGGAGPLLVRMGMHAVRPRNGTVTPFVQR